jgi:hypothetical protein
MDLTIINFKVANWRSPLGFVRFISEDDWVDSAGAERVADSYAQFTLDVDADTYEASLNSIPLVTTTDAIVNERATIRVEVCDNARWNKPMILAQGLSILETFAPLAQWPELRLYAAAQNPYRDTSGYTKSETIREIELRVEVAGSATPSTLGSVAISAPAALPGFPVAVGKNDYASPSNVGLLSTGAQTFAGRKTFQDGASVTGNSFLFSGSYTDWRSTAPQHFARLETGGMDMGQPLWINNYFESAREPGDFKGQYGGFSVIASGPNSGGFIVPVAGAGYSPAGNPGTDFVYGANFLAQVGTGAAWPDYTRVIEADLNNYKADVPLREPAGPPGFQTLVGFEIVSGGPYKPDYGIRVTSSSPDGGSGYDNNKWRVALRLGVDSYSFRGIELNNPPVNVGSGAIVGQAASGFDTLNFARNTDSGFTGNFIRLRTGSLLSDLFRVDGNGFVAAGAYYLGVAASAPYIFPASGDPNGVRTGFVGSMIPDTSGAGIWYKASGAGTNTGWVLIS